MPEVIFHEIELTGRCFLMGMEFMILYDMLRLSRLLLPRGFFFIGVEDFIYWTYIGIRVSAMLYCNNNGVLRGYAIVSAGIGMILYNCVISLNLLKLLKKTLRYIKMNSYKQ